MKSLIASVFIWLVGTCSPLLAADVYFHLNKPIYVEGETVFFKIYSPQDLNKNFEVPTLISLYSPDGTEIVDKAMIKGAQRGNLSGKFKLPEIEKEGKYLLRAYFNDKVYTVVVPVYKKTLPQDFVFVESDGMSSFQEIQSNKVNILADKADYGAREPVLLKISDSDPNSYLEPFNYSVSVFKQAPGDYQTMLLAKEKEFPLGLSTALRGTVRLMDDDQLLANSMIVAYFINSETFTSTYSDAEGNVLIDLDAVDQRDHMYMQAFTPAGVRLGEVRFAKSQDIEVPFIKENPEFDLPRNVAINNYIYQAIQISAIAKSTVLMEPVIEKKLQYYSNLDFTDVITPDNFDQLVSFRDAVREILFYAKIKTNRKTGKEEISLRNKTDRVRYKSSPLYFVNGIPLLDTETIMNLNLERVETIKVANESASNGQFWQMGLYGVIAITLKPGVKSPVLSTSPVFTDVEGNFERVDFEKNIPEKGPFLTNELLWSHVLYTDKSDSIEIEYSDDYSPFIVEVVGMTRAGKMELSRKMIKRK